MFKTAVVICSFNYLIAPEAKCRPTNGSNLIMRYMTRMLNISRRAVVSCKAKKKQDVRSFSGLCDHYSELFTWMTGLIFKML